MSNFMYRVVLQMSKLCLFCRCKCRYNIAIRVSIGNSNVNIKHSLKNANQWKLCVWEKMDSQTEIEKHIVER